LRAAVRLERGFVSEFLITRHCELIVTDINQTLI